MRGREVAPKDVLAAAGPPRMVPRSSEYDAEGAYQADAQYAQPLERELQKKD